MSFFLGDTVLNVWNVIDGSNAPIAGCTYPGDFTFTFVRQSGSTVVAASETITVAESSVAGTYVISYTPANLGLYSLELLETNDAVLGRSFRFQDASVLAAGSVFAPTFTNAYCAETDIERWLQVTIDSTTRPSDTNAAAFAESRASVLSSLCARWGYAVTPSTVTSGSRLEDLLREANAIGAALDYCVAQEHSYRPNKSDRTAAFQALWEQYTRGPQKDLEAGILYQEIRGNLASLSTDHILSGDTVAYTEGAAPTNAPIGIGMGSLF